MSKRAFLPILFLCVTLGWMLVALYMIFLYAPEEATMGLVQRIFYFHVSSAWTAYLGYFVMFVGSVGYLAKRSVKMDLLAHSAGEVGFVFCTLILITGPLWAKPVWGIWWPWDVRITSTFVLWLLYVSYLVLRDYFDEPERSAPLSAVVSFIGFLVVPINYFAIRLWRTHHPSPVIMGGEGSGLDPQMKITFFVTLGAFTALFFYLLWQRFTIRSVEREIVTLRRQMIFSGLK